LDDVALIDPSVIAQLHKFILAKDFHFGGYAKWNTDLLEFIRSVHQNHGLKLDPIYTGKALFGLFDIIQKGSIPPGSKALFIHTGGLQGVSGFEERFKIKLFKT